MPTRHTKRKIVITIILTGLLSMASLYAEDAGTNLVKNNGFEDDPAGSNPAGYDLWKGASNGTCSVDDGVGYKSKKSVKVAGASNIAYQYTIDVLPGEKYLVESLCKQKGQGTPLMTIYWKSATHQWNWPAGKTIATYKPFEGEWRQAFARVQVPAEGVAQLTVLLGVENQKSGNDIIWFDNISIKKIPAQKISHAKISNYIHPLPALPIEPNDYSLNKSRSEVLNTLRMGVFSYSAISKAEAETQIKQMRDSGFNAIITEGQRYLFVDTTNHPPLPDVLYGSLPYPDLVRHTKIVTDACHKYGLKVYLHLEEGFVSETFTNVHPDWMTISLKDGKQKPIWGVVLYACVNNNDFSMAYYQRLDNLIKETAPDGLMVDETGTLYDLCGCPSCRKKFKKDTGSDLPEVGAPWLNDLDSPLYKTFLAWRLQNYKQVNQKIREILLTHTPDGTMLSYYACPYYERAWADHGASIDLVGDIADIIGWEVGGWYKDRVKSWPLFIANLKLVRSASENKDGNIFFIDNPPTYSELYYTWLLGLSQGAHQYWSCSASLGLKKSRTALIQWEMKYENYLAGLRSSADIAVLCSTRNNNLINTPSGSINRQNSFFAVCNTLTLAHIPYKVIVDKDWQTSALSNKAKTVIMMNVGLVSDAEAEVIRRFVKNGGTLIASAETSLYNAAGVRRSNFALADLFGCNFNRLIKEGSTLVIKGKHPLLGKLTGQIDHPDDFFAVETNGSVKVLGYLQCPGVPDFPYLLLNNYGKGKVIYFAGHPETSLYMTEVNNGTQILPRDVCAKPRDPKMAELFCDIVRNVDTGSTTADNLPPGVVMETYTHNYKGAQGIQVHLLNLTGMVPDPLLPETSRITFPDIRKLLPDQGKPIQITVRGKNIRNAFLLSPDFDGLFEIPIKKRNDAVICTLPSFARYLIIYFNQGAIDALYKLAKIPVCTGQPEIKIIEKTEPPLNLTAKKNISASSENDYEHSASQANDGVYQAVDNDNCWCSANNEDVNSWWMFDLGSKILLDKVRVQYRNIGDLYQFVPKSVTIQISSDSTNWTSIVRKSTNVPNAGSAYDGKLYEYTVGTSARYFRLLFEDGGTTYAGYKVIELVEVEVVSKK